MKSKKLSPEALNNLVGFFKVLREIDQEQKLKSKHKEKTFSPASKIASQKTIKIN